MRLAEEAVVLKRFLLIFSDLIFDSRVDPGRPSLAAAPDVRTPVLCFRAGQRQSSLSVALRINRRPIVMIRPIEGPISSSGLQLVAGLISTKYRTVTPLSDALYFWAHS